MTANACQQCGAVIAQPRGGSRPKKFCSGACRARWNRNRRAKPEKIAQPARPRPAITDEQRLRDLEGLYRRLLEDIETEGTLIPSGQGGAMKGNPSAALLVRVAAELARLSPPQAEEAKDDDEDDLGNALRIA